MDTDRNTVRKRINELYIEAQRNLDHRNFQTRIKYQELFEVTLPQARYILLDEGRRDQYDALVRSTRAPQGNMAGGQAAAVPRPNAPATADDSIPGQTPTIEPIPSTSMPEITPEQRDEQWKKWKSGLAEVLERESTDDIRPKTKPSVANSGSTGSTETSSKKESKPRPVINFDFGEGNEDTPRRGESAPVPGAEEFVEEAKARLDPKEVERRRTEHRRELMKEVLVSEGIKGMVIGAAAVAIPGIMAMVFFMSYFYPRNRPAGLPIPEGLVWLLWLIILGVGGFFTAKAFSKAMKKKRAADLAKLPYEELVKLSTRAV